jgi:hypothetical protein
MLRCIHHSLALAKQLSGLRRAGKKAESAAGKAEAIVQDIRQYGCQCEVVLCKRTRKGEQRLKNCVKYDLGSGYRLVTVRNDCHLFVVFVGSHDDTDQWIEHHRYDFFAPDALLYRSEECVVAEDAPATDCHESSSAKATEDDYEEVLAAKLEESHLKAVFQGLFSQPTALPEKTDKVKAQKPAAGRLGKAMGVI